MAGYASHGVGTSAVTSGETTIAVMRADNRKLVHAGLTKPSWLSIADQGA